MQVLCTHTQTHGRCGSRFCRIRTFDLQICPWLALMTTHHEVNGGFRVEQRLPSGAQRVLVEARNLTHAESAALQWRRLLRRLGGMGIVVIVDVATSAVVAVHT